MIPYEQLAAALERRAAPAEDVAASTGHEDTTMNGAQEAASEYEIGDVLSDEEAS